MPANLENSAVATGLEKVSFHSNPKERQCQKCSNYCTIALISQASKVMLKILQVRLQQYMNCEIPDVQAEFRNSKGTRDQIANIHWIIRKARVPEKHVLLYWLHQSLWLCGSKTKTNKQTNKQQQQNWGKFWKRWEYQTTLPASWEICMQVKKQQLELDVEQQTDSKLGKEYVKAEYCHPAYLTYMQSTSYEMPSWMDKLESRLLGEISVTSDMQITPPIWQKTKKN